MNKVRLILTSILLLFSLLSYSQVTTSSMSGKITDGKETLIGATVVAIHEESGTKYVAITNTDGRFTIQGMRTGGPYLVEVSYIGYDKSMHKEIYLQLGETYVLSPVMKESGQMLQEVVIRGVGSKFAGEKTGAATNISSREMTLMPTLNRSLSDYTKISPYSTGGSSFIGKEAYTTNITVDGANFNNNFGLASTGMPGVSGEPISMDAIEEMQVVVAPFDVRQSNFTGAGVNAVTKSGTNKFKGTAYGFYRNQDYNGKKIRDTELSVSESAKKVLGVSLGGAIIKNKLFFFVSGEMESTLTPGNTIMAMDAGRDPKDPNVNTRVSASDLQKFSSILQSKYGYNPGRYENWGGDNEKNNKLLARIDWNINNNHKFTARYNFSNSEAIFRPSNSGDANPGINNNAGRSSKDGGIAFEYTQYYNSSSLHSLTGELNSRFGSGISNKFLVAYTKYDQPRKTDSDMFPFIDIMDGTVDSQGIVTSTLPMMTAGYELFSYQNAVKNNTLIVTDNVTAQWNKHTFTGGLSYENQYISNSYLRQGTGYYRFKDLASFERYANGEGNGKPFNSDYHPVNFGFTYPINGFTDPVAELSFGQFSAYLQDEWNIADNFKLTAGLRIDLPMYLDGAVDNPDVASYSFRDGEKLDLASWPDAQILWSPRVGFNWNPFGSENKDLTIRGGTGVFTGRIPFVWFTNQPSNSGMIQYQLMINENGGVNSRNQLAQIPFKNNAYDLLKDPSIDKIFPQKNVLKGRLAAIDKEFKLPQVWRTSLAFDLKLPLDMKLTMEGIFTKDINSIYFDNINLQPAASVVKEGIYERPYWSNSTDAVKYMTPPFTDVIVMRNTSEGKGLTFATQLDLPRVSGFSGMVSYTYNWAEEVAGKNGSDPYSAWRFRYIHGSPNSQELGYTMNNTHYRVTAGVNYKVEYFKKQLASTFSLFYQGYQGGAYSYYYSNDMNKDGTTNDLMYIPKDRSDVIWKNGAADADAYFAFAEQDPYLSKHAGSYVKRFGAFLPWYNRIDFRFLQDIAHNFGKTKNTLQFSVDIFNLANLFDSSWGLNKTTVTNSPLRFEGLDAATGKAIVSTTKIDGKYITNSFKDPSSVSSTWTVQLGLRYIFN